MQERSPKPKKLWEKNEKMISATTFPQVTQLDLWIEHWLSLIITCLLIQIAGRRRLQGDRVSGVMPSWLPNSTYLHLDFHLFHDKAERTQQGNLLRPASLSYCTFAAPEQPQCKIQFAHRIWQKKHVRCSGWQNILLALSERQKLSKNYPGLKSEAIL